MKRISIFSFILFCCVAPGSASPLQKTDAQSSQPSLASLAGDWEWVIGPPAKAVLHIRVGGRTTSSIVNTIRNTSISQDITDLQLKGNKFSYKTPGGGIYEGTVSADGQSIQGKYSESPTIITWKRTMSAEQATAADAAAAQKAQPTDGTWSGEAHVTKSNPALSGNLSVMPLVYRFSGPLATCIVDTPGKSNASNLPCKLTLDGNKVHAVGYGGFLTLDGVLTSPTKITGTLTISAGQLGVGWVGSVTLTRTSTSLVPPQ